MANKLKGEIGVEAEGGEIVFRPTFETICGAEESLGASIMQLVDRHDRAEMSVKEQVAFLGHFAAGETKTEDVGQRLFDAGGLNLIRTTVYEVLIACVSGGKEGKKNSKTPAGPKKSTGGTSPK